MAQSPLDMRHLQTLVALAETGSVSRAAERVFVTQSALSHQLKLLESHYGAPLFERGTKPLRFTQPGQRLLALARQVREATAQAERDVAHWVSGGGGQLRIAVECHTCFDWLMPAMDAFRGHWPDVELDLVGGFQTEPMGLLDHDIADFVVLHDRPPSRAGVVVEALFDYENVAILAPGHALAAKPWLTPRDFVDETLISYPVADDMLDVVRHFLAPAGIKPRRRNAELTVAILQLVASGRGIAALPAWSVSEYLKRGYVVAKPLGKRGLRCDLYAGMPESLSERPYMRDFVARIREHRP
ncbi:MAG TPA: LysR family transcriptional regulator [Fontimonas sp.]